MGDLSGWHIAVEYLTLGVEHILLGIDHLLFVLALLRITRGTMHLIKTITAFSVAHSITLGLATLGFIHVPSKPVEALIALSIVMIAAEIIDTRRGIEGITAHGPWVVAFRSGRCTDSGLRVRYAKSASQRDIFQWPCSSSTLAWKLDNSYSLPSFRGFLASV